MNRAQARHDLGGTQLRVRECDDATSLRAAVMDGDAIQLRKRRAELFRQRADAVPHRFDADLKRIPGGATESDLTGDVRLPKLEPARIGRHLVLTNSGPACRANIKRV